MKIDTNKLKNVSRKADGKITAQCPACAVGGGDAKGEHLAVFPDGKFGCVLHEKDKVHNRKILELVGVRDRGDGGSGCRLTVKPFHVDDSTVLMKAGSLGRVKTSPEQKVEGVPPHQAVAVCPETVEHHPEPTPTVVDADVSPRMTDPVLRDFFNLPALAACWKLQPAGCHGWPVCPSSMWSINITKPAGSGSARTR